MRVVWELEYAEKKLRIPIADCDDYRDTALLCMANKAMIEDRGGYDEVIAIVEPLPNAEVLERHYCPLVQNRTRQSQRISYSCIL